MEIPYINDLFWIAIVLKKYNGGIAVKILFKNYGVYCKIFCFKKTNYNILVATKLYQVRLKTQLCHYKCFKM